MTVEIRRAGPGDADAIAEVHAASWRSAYRGIFSDAYLDGDIAADRRRHWRTCLEAGGPADCGVFVAIEEAACVGFICIRLDADPAWGPLLDNLHVRPDRKSEGIGRNLIAEGAAWVRTRGPYKSWHLWVIDSNTPARRVYEHLGWVASEPGAHLAPDGTRYPVWRYTHLLHD